VEGIVDRERMRHLGRVYAPDRAAADAAAVEQLALNAQERKRLDEQVVAPRTPTR
jgi:hypothetical protein